MAFGFWPSHTHLCCSNAAHSSPVKFKTQVNRLFYDRSFQIETTEAPSAYFQTSTPTPPLPFTLGNPGVGLWGIVGKITILNREGGKKQRVAEISISSLFPSLSFFFFLKKILADSCLGEMHAEVWFQVSGYLTGFPTFPPSLLSSLVSLVDVFLLARIHWLKGRIWTLQKSCYKMPPTHSTHANTCKFMYTCTITLQ